MVYFKIVSRELKIQQITECIFVTVKENNGQTSLEVFFFAKLIFKANRVITS
jgi:hypothetical protein